MNSEYHPGEGREEDPVIRGNMHQGVSRWVRRRMHIGQKKLKMARQVSRKDRKHGCEDRVAMVW